LLSPAPLLHKARKLVLFIVGGRSKGAAAGAGKRRCCCCCHRRFGQRASRSLGARSWLLLLLLLPLLLVVIDIRYLLVVVPSDHVEKRRGVADGGKGPAARRQGRQHAAPQSVAAFGRGLLRRVAQVLDEACAWLALLLLLLLFAAPG
jgi:hypothetical protein